MRGQADRGQAEMSPLALLASWWLAGWAQRPFRTAHPLRIPLPREEPAREDLVRAGSTPLDDRPGRTVQAHREAVLVDAIVADILATVDTSATRVHISLQPTVIRAEPGSLAMLVRNLLAYAVRHNIPDGGVWVSLTTAGRLTTLTVEHTGPPLGSDDLPALLARSYQSDTDVELAIVRTVVRAHHGTVAATARSGGGLLVRVTLPTR
jgi:signal transduction histidine kinase